MTFAHKIEIESVGLFLLAAFAGIVFAMYSNRLPNNRNVYHLPAMDNLQPTPTAQPLPQPMTFSQPSPDGKKEVRMTVATNKDESKTYEVTSFDVASNVTTPIYKVTLATDSLSIPFNAWSPDDNFVFVQKNTKSGSQALVFRGNGQALADSEQFYNAYDIFTARNTGETYQETTGWASETLLIINTTNADNSKGPSYWLEVPSKAVIQLSTEF